MAAPTLVTAYPATSSTNWTTSTTPKTGPVTVAAGDVLVSVVLAEDGKSTVSTPTGGTGVTWTSQANVGTSTSSSRVACFTSAPSAQTFTESVAIAGIAATYGWQTLRFSGSAGIGAVPTPINGTATNISITTTQANSAVILATGDWNATTGTRSYTLDGSASTPTAIATNVGAVGNTYVGNIVVFPDVGAAGAHTIAVSAPAGQKLTIVAVEVKGTAGSTSGSVTAVAATSTSAAAAPAVTGVRAGIVTAIAATATALALAPAVLGSIAAAVTPPVAAATATARVPAATGSAATTGPWSNPQTVDTTTGATVTPPAATASAASLPPAVIGAATVQAMRSTASAVALAPTTSTALGTTGPWSDPQTVNTTIASGSVAAVAATSTGAANAPVVTANATVAAVCATGSAAATAPLVNATLATSGPWSNPATVNTSSASGAVTAVSATGSALALEPVVSAEVVLSGGGPAMATALAVAPSVSGATVAGASVNAVPATASGLAIAPSISGSVVTGGTVAAIKATGSGTATAPVVRGSATVAAVRALGSAAAVAPVVSGYVDPSSLRDVTILSVSEVERAVTVAEVERAVSVTEITRPFAATIAQGGAVKIHAQGRAFYTLTIVTDPQITDWEASFDGGLTWVAGEPTIRDANTWRWLVAGPGFVADTTPAATVAQSMAPLIRAVDTPEVLVEHAPLIRVYT